MANRDTKGKFIKGHVGYKASLGKKLTDEERKKLGEAQKGNKKPPRSEEHTRRLVESRRKNDSYSHICTPEHKKKISESNRGEKNYNYKGGVTPLLMLIRRCFKSRQWRSDIFQRDNYTCVWCGVRGAELNADHIKTFKDIFCENNIKSLEDALNCEEFWNINNGRTLCKPCHLKTDTWGNRKIKK